MAVQPVGPEIQSQEINDNFSDVENNVESHKAEKANNTDDVHDLITDGKVIEESGSNENGYYVRFADGTQVCWLNRIVDETDAGELTVTGVWLYPATFINTPFTFINVFSSHLGDAVQEAQQGYRGAISDGNDQAFYSAFKPSTTMTGRLRASVFAQGRWK